MSDRRDPAVEALADTLDRGLRRAQDAIDRAARRNADLLEKMARHTGEPWLSDLAKHGSAPLWQQARESMARSIRENANSRWQVELERKLARAELKHRLHLEKREAKRLAREARHKARAAENASIVGGVVSFAVAGVLVTLSMMNAHEMWWLIFPALGIGLNGAKSIEAKLSQRKALPAPTSPQPERTLEPAQNAIDPRDARVDGVCAKILNELKSAPASVKELVGNSDKTIEQLRATCRSLTQRERELRALVDPVDAERLAKEREQLVSRIANERDDVTKQRFSSALEALDQNLRQRGELTTAAARFEAEHTRIAYTLESLYTQILRLKSADSASHDPASAALRQSLAQLGEEMEAVAEAMEAVHREDLSPIAEVVSPGSDPGKRERERE